MRLIAMCGVILRSARSGRSLSFDLDGKGDLRTGRILDQDISRGRSRRVSCEKTASHHSGNAPRPAPEVREDGRGQLSATLWPLLAARRIRIRSVLLAGPTNSHL